MKNLSYKIRFCACLLITACFLTAVQPLTSARILYVDEEEYDGISQNFTPLDITSSTNRGFVDDVANDGKGGWGDGGADNDLSDFKLFGSQKFRGVPFDVIDPAKNNGTSCIVLRGQNDESVPLTAEVSVGKKAGGVYFLHAGSWLSKSVGEYVFCYADGTEEVIELVSGRDIADWWGTSETETMRTAWIGQAPSAGVVSLGLYALENPHPEKEISKIRLQSNGDGTYIMVVAITLTDTQPYLTRIKENEEFNPDTSDWWRYDYPRNYEEITGTAMDVSFLLDAPSGKHGFGKADGENIVFEDGTREKFWGVNVDGEMLYPEYEQAEYTAQILAQRGINLARMHMYDVPWVQHNIFGWTERKTNTQTIDAEKLDKMHYFVAQLKKHGIYAFLDLCASRQVMEGDGIRDWQYIGEGYKHTVFYDDYLQKLQMQATEQLMGTVNPYTGLKMCEDPTILIVNFNNESSIFNDTFKSEYYRKIITKKYNNWLAKKYPVRQKLHEAWKDSGEGLLDSEDQFEGTVKIMGSDEQGEISGQRKLDNAEFLSYTMDQYLEEMINHYRSIGGRQIISGGTIWGERTMTFLKGNERSNVMDFHAYFLHPTNNHIVETGLTLPQAPESWISNLNCGLMGYFAGTRVKGKPFTISEWNGCEPNPYLSEMPILMGAYSGMQNWYPMQYTMGGDMMSIEYRNDAKLLGWYRVFTGPDSPQSFDVMPAGAIAFHSVTESEAGYYSPRDGKSFYDASKQSNIKADKTYLIGKSGIADRDLDNKQTGGENLVLAAEKDAKTNKKPYVSLTDELSWDMTQGIFKMNTNKSQAAAGFLKDEQIELDDIIINTTNSYATIALSSLSKSSIYETERLLFTASARARKTGLKLSNDGTKILDGGSAPTLVEPVRGTFIIKTDADVCVWALSPQGKRTMEIPVTRDKNSSRFILTGKEKAINFEIIKTGGSKNKNPEISLGAYVDKPLFSDVLPEDREKIERVYLTETMRATGEKIFSPEMAISRGDFVEALVKVLNIVPKDAKNFADVTEKDCYYKQIATARYEGIVFGAEDGKFYPKEDITVSEANEILKRAGVYKRINGENITRKTAAELFYEVITG